MIVIGLSVAGSVILTQLVLGHDLSDALIAAIAAVTGALFGALVGKALLT